MSSASVLRIFVVDDENVISTTLTLILSMNGYSSRSFTDPLEALAAAKSDIPDVLISDVTMPSLSGVDLAIRMQQRCPDCKILLFSGQAATQDLLKDARAQGHSFPLLLKPVHPAKLLAEIQRLVEGIAPTTGGKMMHLSSTRAAS